MQEPSELTPLKTGTADRVLPEWFSLCPRFPDPVARKLGVSFPTLTSPSLFFS